MRRRQLLRALPAGVLAALAGCQSGELRPPSETTTATTTTTTTTSDRPPARIEDVDLPVLRSEMRQAVPQDWITAIIEPAFAEDWRSVPREDGDPTLPESDPIIGLVRDGEARAYPMRVLNRHEIVNDEFAGPIAVTYCVICGSAVAFDRTVGDGTPTTFGVSGKLWRSALVMYDSVTESLWSQILAAAIRGELTGEQLTILPASITTWGEWQSDHPDTTVLLPPPLSATVPDYDHDFDYFDSLYSYEDEAQLIGYDTHDGDLHPKTLVVGIRADGIARAYPFHVVSEENVINDTIGSLTVVVARSPEGSLVAYERRVDGTRLTFEPAGARYIAAGGSRWKRTTGKAIDGPYEGQTLTRANRHAPMFWIGWSKFNSNTEVYGYPNVRGTTTTTN